MRKIFIGSIFALLFLIAANGIFVTWPTLKAKQSDPRNANVTLYSYFGWGMDPDVVVLDLWSVSPQGSIADVDRVLLDAAEALKDGSFSKVRLAYRGAERFQLSGDYFRQIGRERAWQNPVYTMRTLAENVQDTDGRPAFATWTGGLLGVVAKQMEDHKELHMRWYLNDLATR